MRKRWLVLSEYFGIRSTWLLLLLVAAVLINLNLFIISRSPEWAFIDFGTSSFAMILKNLPFGWLSLVFVLTIGLVLTMKMFSWSYLLPFKLYIGMLVGGIVFVGAVAFASGLNETLYSKLVDEPGAGDSMLAQLYCLTANQALDHENALIGEIMYHNPLRQELVIQTPTLEMVTVHVNENTQWLGDTHFQTFQIAKILGHHAEDCFEASHIKVETDKNIDLWRAREDCMDEDSWEYKNQILEQRREAVKVPIMIDASLGGQVVKTVY